MIALLLLLLAGASAEAVQLNTEGFRLYRKGELAPALEKFKQAIGADEKYALAHYNAAATMARLQTEAGYCESLDQNFDILGELTRSIALDPGRRKRALADPDFKPFLGTLSYRRLLLGADEKKNLKLLLEGTTFTSLTGWGSFENSVSLRFLPNGALLLGLREVSDTGPFTNVIVDHPGGWRVEGNTIHVRMSRAIDRKYDGKAIFEKDEIEFPVLGKLVNYVSGACDA